MLSVKYFGEIEERVGTSEERLPQQVKTLSHLLAYLKSEHHIQEQWIKVAVNHELVTDSSTVLKETDEIAILSPFAGG